MIIQINPKQVILEPIIGLDIETTGLNPLVDTVKLIAISTKENLYVLDTKEYSSEYITNLLNRINKECEVTIAHNAKFDCGFLYANYGVLLTNWFCTLLNSQILTNGTNMLLDNSLKGVLERYLNIKHNFSKEKNLLQKSFSLGYTADGLYEKQLGYVAEDVIHLIPLYEALVMKSLGMGMLKITRLENRLIPVLSKMEIGGCSVDVEGWKNIIETVWKPKLIELENALDKELRKISKKKEHKFKRNRAKHVEFTLFGDDKESDISSDVLNYSSSAQIIQIFKDLGEEVPLKKVKVKDKKTGKYTEELRESVEDGELIKFINETPESPLIPFISVLRDFRGVDKLISTYGEKFLEGLDEANFVHTSYTQTFTATGRLSSKAPNLQNIPALDPSKGLGDIRKFFVASPGHKLITCDMGGAEIAIAADYSGEPLLLNALLNGDDMHSQLASVTFSIIFGKKITVSKSSKTINVDGKEYVLENLRNDHKSVVFAKFYKAGAKRVYGVLSKYINAHHAPSRRLDIASEISKALDRKMPKLSGYLSALIQRAQTEGKLVSSKLGRIRYFDENVYGEAANYPIQGTNAEALKIALIKIDDYLTETKYGRLVMNVHDEVVVEVKDEFAEEVAERVRNIMAGSLSYFLRKVKATASVTIKNYWQK